jgi:hypothetical protein
MLLAMSVIVGLKVAPTVRVIINIFYSLPSFFYLVLLYFFPEVPLSSLSGIVDEELSCGFGLRGSCWQAMRLSNIADRVSLIMLLALW